MLLTGVLAAATMNASGRYKKWWTAKDFFKFDDQPQKTHVRTAEELRAAWCDFHAEYKSASIRPTH